MPQGKKVRTTSKLVKPVVHARHVSMNTTNARCGLGLESAKLIQDICLISAEGAVKFVKNNGKNLFLFYLHWFKSSQFAIFSEDYSATDLDQGLDFGKAQVFDSPHFQVSKMRFLRRLAQTREYLATVELREPIREICKNEHELCTAWAVHDECNKNPAGMKRICAPACFTCDYLDVETRCALDPNAPKAWEPGDLDAMFTRLSSEPYLSRYDVQILSSPETTGGPWVITLDNFLSKQEADILIELGELAGRERSKGMGDIGKDGRRKSRVTEIRTSTNAWCNRDCAKNETAKEIVDRISDLTLVHHNHSEALQLLKYEVGQFYKAHHDYIALHLDRQSGVRIFTFFLYLNDVEAGGGTHFDELDLTVMPKTGRALVWPSVLDANPNEKDGRTTHAALPVDAGLKYAANAWYHMSDFQTPNSMGCDF